MGRTRYITTDLDLEGPIDLEPIARAFGDDEIVHFCGPAGDHYRSSIGLAAPSGSESADIEFFCMLAEALDERCRSILRSCSRIDFNLGYEGGSEPRAWMSRLTAEAMKRVASLKGDVVVTIYPIHKGDV